MPDPVNAAKSIRPLPKLAAAQPSFKLLVVSGGRAGVGATTIALGLAQALAQDALRIVLIDADRQRPTLAAASGVEVTAGIDEVLSGRKTIHEALLRGPAGLQILAGAPSPDGLSVSERAIERLLRQIQSLSKHADLVIVDAGNQPTELSARLWQAADPLVLVTSPEAVAVMDTYALIKRLLSNHPIRQQPVLVVSQATGTVQAADVHRRIDQSCRRFLQIPVAFGGALPWDAGGVRADDADGHVATGLETIARQLMTGHDAPYVTPLAA